MSVSLPDSMIYDLLGRLPSQSYKIEYRDYRPQSNTSSNVFTNNQSFRINMSGAVNEFILVDTANFLCEMTGIYLLPTSTSTADAKQKSETVPSFRPFLGTIASVRETVNSGSLTTYENTERTTFNPFQCMRAVLTKGSVHYSTISRYTSGVDPAEGTILDDFSYGVNSDDFGIQGLESAGVCPRSLRTLGLISKLTTAGANPAVPQFIRGGSVRQFSCPLTAFSTVFQSSSVIPIGLFSTYSAQSYGLEFRIATGLEGFNRGLLTPVENADTIYVMNPRIRVKIIKVLQPETMSAILSLYNKSENFEVGKDGMKIPLTLQLNSLQVNHHQFAIVPAQSEYNIRIPTTASSLRGLCFRFIRQSVLNGTDLPPNVSGYPLADEITSEGALVVTKFGIKIGGECILESRPDNYVVTLPKGAAGAQESVYVNTADGFFREQRRLGGHLFSVKHHTRDAGIQDGMESLYSAFGVMNAQGQKDSSIVRPYVICLENLNHFENSNQASGLDMRSIGGVDLVFSLGKAVAGDAGTLKSGITEPPDVPYTMLVMTVEDYVLEVSRSGVKDVTSQVL